MQFSRRSLPDHSQLMIYFGRIYSRTTILVFLILTVICTLCVWHYSRTNCTGNLIYTPSRTVRVPFKFLINEESICRNGDVFLLIYVHSAPHHAKQREFIRSTWGNTVFQELFAMKLIFIVGEVDAAENSSQTNLTEESQIHRDIIQGNFRDTYRNLILKESCSLQWVATYCSHATYIMKADDDVVVQHFLLMPWLRSLGDHKKPTILCLLYHEFLVLRNTSNKWYMPETIYDGVCYPDYCAGPGRIYSKGAPGRLFDASDWAAELVIHLEDLYFTGYVASKAGVDREHVPRLLDLSEDFEGHTDWSSFIYHARNLDTQKSIWWQFMDTDKLLARSMGTA